MLQRASGVGDEVPVDDVTEPSFQRAQRFLRRVSLVAFAVVERAAGTVRERIWVTAAMWSAWFMVRFPRRDSRNTWAVGFPDDRSTGAVPL